MSLQIQLADRHALARVYASVFSEDQLSALLAYYDDKGPALFTEMAEFRQSDGIPPLLSFLEPASAGTSPSAIYDILVGMTFINAANLVNDADAQDYAEILVEGAGYDPDIAEDIAEKIIVQRNVYQRFGSWLSRRVAGLANTVKDVAVVGTLLETLKSLTEEKIEERLQDPTATSFNNLVEWRRLGAEIRSRQEDGFLVGSAILYEEAVRGGPVRQYERAAAENAIEGGNPFGAVDQIAGFTNLEDMLATMLGVPQYVTEQGNPIEIGPEEQAAAREAFARFLQLEKQSKTTPYHVYASRHPETGGLFSSLGRLVKKAAKAVGSVAGKVVKTAVPTVMGAVGGMVGGPAGQKLGQQWGNMTADAYGTLVRQGISNPMSLVKNPWRLTGLGAESEVIMRSLGGGGRKYSPGRPRTALARTTRPSDAELLSVIRQLLAQRR